MVVNEPHFLSSTGEKYLLRADHVNDIFGLIDGGERIPATWKSKRREKSVLKWKGEGNEAVKQNKLGFYHQVSP